MNNLLQTRLDRIDTALATLIDSIAVYSPSITAANTLLEADDELQNGLKQLVQHQKNHARIVALHDKIAQQNAHITSTITTLADIRTDLLSTPTSLPRKDARNVEYTELLDYAKNISRYTVPPTSQKPLNLPKIQTDATAATNGESEGEKERDGDGKGIGTEALENEEKKWLEPLMQIPFAPWVSDDVMRAGALAQIQAMVERGEDPAELKPEGGKAGAEKDQAEGQGMEDVRMETTRDDQVTTSRGGEARQEKKATKPEVFGGLDLYDPSIPDEDG
ncbi:hypothetical protein ACLMJK_007413 [Lecanora helva]